MDQLLWFAAGAVVAFFYIQRNPAVLQQFGTGTGVTPTPQPIALPGGFQLTPPSINPQTGQPYYPTGTMGPQSWQVTTPGQGIVN